MSPRPPLSQQAFLRRVKAELELEWDALAVRAGISPRALKCYRLPDGSSNHRGMPLLARRAIEALLRQPRAVKAVVPQQELLQSAMEACGVTLPELAELIGTKPLTMKNWMRPDVLPSHRRMPPLARSALDQLLHDRQAAKRTRKRLPK